MKNQNNKILGLESILNKETTRSLNDIETINKLLAAPELFIKSREEDEYLDKLSLKIKLYSGKEFTIEEYISENLIKYSPRFHKDFYYEIARLNGLSKEVMDVYRKPDCAREFTINFIYGRFPRKVFNELRRKSNWTDVPGIRANKLFQYLTTIASEHLDLYIDQAYSMMLSSQNISDFKLRYSREYKIYFQLDLF